MGRDEHKTSRRGRSRLAQTPENQKFDGNKTEFFQEFGNYHPKVTGKENSTSIPEEQDKKD